MNCVVTGGAGFIGSHLVDRLIKDGHSVVVIDDLSGGNQDFLKHHLSLGKLKLVKADLRDQAKLKRAIPAKTDMVFHLAANADISRGVEDPSLDFENTILATYSLLEAMRYHKIKKLFYTSGSGIYGDLGRKYLPETHGPLIPVSMYGASKLGAEGMISAFVHLFDMQAWILRPANIIGPRSTHGVIFDFIRRLKSNPSELRILGDGQQSKSYLYVTDVIDAIMLVIKKADQRINIFNLSSNSFITVNEIADIVIKGLKLKKVTRLHSGGTVGWKGDVAIIRLRNQRIRRLGWQSKYTSRQAVKATVEALINDKRLEKK